MELSKPIEFARDTAGMVAKAGRFALHQMQGGAWAELPPLPQGPYEAPKRVSANITYYTTGDQLRLDIPDNINLGQE